VLRLHNYTIAAKLRLMAGVSVALVFAMGTAGFFYMNRTSNNASHIVNDNYGRIKVFREIKESLNTADHSMLSLALSSDPSIKQSEKQKLSSATVKCKEGIQQFGEIIKNVIDPKTRTKLSQTLEKLEALMEKRRDLDVKFIDLTETNMGTEASKLWSDSIAQISWAENDLLGELIKVSEERAEFRFNELIFNTIKGKRIFVVISLLVMIFIFFGTRMIADGIKKALFMGIDVANRLSEGDLTVSMPTDRKDETGRLLLALDNMVQKWRGILREIGVSSDTIASASQELTASAEQMLKGAEEQSTRASMVASASEEMSQTVLDIAKNSNGIAASGGETLKIARNGKTIVDQSVHEAQETSNTVEVAASKIKQLGDKSRQIEEIVDVINDIADQTNLLALNAAIEAARAGEQGRGFAVVADEVRKLAEKASNSTAEIVNMVSGIEFETAEAIKFMEEAKIRAVSEATVSEEAGNALSRIVEDTDGLGLMVHQIASATTELAGASESISSDIEAIAILSKETSNGSRQVVAAAGDLAKLSIGLQDIMKMFKI
jgi:methyl-accepting chemotaxis protein